MQSSALRRASEDLPCSRVFTVEQAEVLVLNAHTGQIGGDVLFHGAVSVARLGEDEPNANHVFLGVQGSTERFPGFGLRCLVDGVQQQKPGVRQLSTAGFFEGLLGQLRLDADQVHGCVSRTQQRLNVGVVRIGIGECETSTRDASHSHVGCESEGLTLRSAHDGDVPTTQ